MDTQDTELLDLEAAERGYANWTEVEAALAAARRQGIPPNFARWLRFAGVTPTEFFELQALGVRSSYGE
ncbi:MAG TPA: hypothetical protein VGI39_16505, partial [Polyangiaceae bacterium]